MFNAISPRGENIIRCFRWQDLKGVVWGCSVHDEKESSQRMRSELHRRLFQLVYKLLPLERMYIGTYIERLYIL